MGTMSFCKPRKNSAKRFFDLAIAIPSIIILSPLLVFIGILVRLKIGLPVLFRQVRPGITCWAQVNGRNARFICSFGFEMVI